MIITFLAILTSGVSPNLTISLTYNKYSSGLGIRGADVTVEKFPQQSRLLHSKRYNFIQSPIYLNVIITFELS
jgi:hypothetical protein